MSLLTFVDWNRLIEEEEKEVVEEGSAGHYHSNATGGGSSQSPSLLASNGSRVPIVEVPPSPPDSQRIVSHGRQEGEKMSTTEETGSSTTQSSGSEEDERDVLQLYCDDTDLPETREDECDYRGRGVVRSTVTAVGHLGTHGGGTAERNRDGKKKVGKDRRCRRRRRASKQQQQQRRSSRPPTSGHHRTETDAPKRSHAVAAPYHRWNTTAAGREENCPAGGRWTVRWIRERYEQVVYNVCNCNETPGVVFAGVCNQGTDVYTLVLKNCNGKRRYWYDRPARRTRVGAVTDFERSMRCRANSIGRTTNLPGYDLAVFGLQNVITDRRWCGAASSKATTVPSLTVVTTEDMFTNPSMHQQLVYKEHRYYDRDETAWRYDPAFQCRVCHGEASVVTGDSTGIWACTCWRHAASDLEAAAADSARVCNTAIVDVKFLLRRHQNPTENNEDDELVCLLRLVTGGGGVITIAELVFQPSGTEHRHNHYVAAGSDESYGGRSSSVVGLETAHGHTCQDVHLNHEDLFPSMSVNDRGGGFIAGVQQYDTKIGRTVDLLHCVVSRFQKQFTK